MHFAAWRWWPNTHAAYHAGIIDNPYGFISADRKVAFAILLTHDQEVQLDSREDSIRYYPSFDDRCRVKLMQTISGDDRKAVRVLRSARLLSPVAPVAGIRYDGLYVLYRPGTVNQMKGN